MRRATLNHAYRLIWNELTQTWVAVSERVRSRGKRCSSAVLLASLVSASPAFAVDSGALPAGGSISAGSGNISTAGKTMTISQGSQRLAINWHSFNIGKDASVTFNQPNASAIALNRVLGTEGSQILGSLKANGQVWLLNPNGVLFGKTAQVSVGGLVASTLGMSDADFLAGRRTFTGAGGKVENQGTIHADYVALLGGQVANAGELIVARLGTAALAAGEQVTLDFSGDRLLNVQVDKGTLKSLAENKGLIQADGGTIIMTARARDALLDSAVNNTGILQARTVENVNGVIKLLGDMQSGTTNVDGTLDASAPNGGNGGFIETSAAHVKIADSARITTRAVPGGGRNGTWLIDPYDFIIAASGGDITGAALSAALGSTDVTIQTFNNYASCTGATCGMGQPTGNGDIFVNDNVAWSSHTLTLSAWRNIEINATLNGTGTAGLALEYGQGATAAGNTATYTVRTPVHLAATGSFSTKLGSDGLVKNYTIITALGNESSSNDGTLQGINGDLAANYVLGADIDAAATSTWNSGAGFTPLGNGWSGAFTGIFDGLGHSISNLAINRSTSDYQGLFGLSQGVIANVGMKNASVRGRDYTGGLVAWNEGTLRNTYARGDVTGRNVVGGLAGLQMYGDLTASYATGNVSGNNSVGGLLGGIGSAAVSTSYAIGSVTGNGSVGGLVGSISGGSLGASYASGSVTGNSNVGGLVGQNNGTVTDSYWNTTTSGTAVGIGAGTNSGATGRTTAQLAGALPTGFASAVWGNADNQSTPYLLSHGLFETTGVVHLGADNTSTPAIHDVITNVRQLQAMGNNLSGKFVLGNDISAAETALWNGGAGFTPVGSLGAAFTGVFNGLGFEIDGLTINRSGSDYQGLFGVASGTLSNVGLRNATISGADHVGTLAGQFASGSVSRVFASGSVGGSDNVGGLIGQLGDNGTLTESYATATVSGHDNVGGLVGGASGMASVADAYAMGDVSGNNAIGGLIGRNEGAAARIFATGAVSGATHAGGLIGENAGTVGNAYWDTTTAGTASGIGSNLAAPGAAAVIGLSTAQLAGALPTGFSAATWANAGNQSTPYLLSHARFATSGAALLGTDAAANPTIYDVIANLTQLQAIGGNLAGSYLLGNAIDASATATWNGGAGFTPIGNTLTEFSGTFNGMGFTIDGLTINRASGSNQGLFGKSSGTITNIRLTNASVVGNSNVGALVGYNHGGTVANAFASGNVSGNLYVGVLAGVNSGTVTNAYTTGTASGTSSVGGLVGYNYQGGASIAGAYSAANVSGSHHLGGLAGRNEGSIANAYATGNVSGSNYDIGGLVGNNAGSIARTYATGAVTGNSNVGGLVGNNFNGNVADSFWNTTSSGTAVGVAASTGTVSNVTGHDTANMHRLSTFSAAGWDIDDAGGTGKVWRIYDGYTNPLLRSFMTGLTVTASSGSRTYDGTDAGLGYTVSGTPDMGHLLGTATTTLSSRNAGNRTATVNGLYSDQHGYDITHVGGAVTVNKASLTITSSDVTKTYDGTTGAAGSAVIASGSLFGADSISGGSYAFADKNAGTGKRVIVSGISVNDGNGGNNYTVTYADNTNSTIQKAALTYNGVTAANKVYDGTTQATVGGTLNGVMGGDDVRLSGAFADRNAGSGKSVVIAVTGADAGNYNAGSLSLLADILTRQVTISAPSVSKRYDGNTAYATTAGDLASLSSQLGVAGDQVTSATIAYADPAPGLGNKTVSLSGLSISDGNGGNNYSIQLAGNSTSSIVTGSVSGPESGPPPSQETYTGALNSATRFLTEGLALMPDSAAGIDVIPCGQKLPPQLSGDCQ